MQEEIENLELVQGLNFDFIDSLENNGTKFLLIFDDSCQKICASRGFEKIPVAGRHLGLTTINIKQNLFHKSIPCRDIDIQNTHLVLCKPPRDVRQVGSLSLQLGLGCSLVDWYKDATSVLFGHLLIDLSPRTEDRLRHCTNSEDQPSKFYIPEQLQHLKILDDGHTKSLHSPRIPTLFGNCKVHFFLFWRKSSSDFSANISSTCFTETCRSWKKNKCLNYRKQITALFQARTTWKKRRWILASKKGLLLKEIIPPFVINHLSWHGTVYPCNRFCIEQ